jgi:hypothetical protein
MQATHPQTAPTAHRPTLVKRISEHPIMLAMGMVGTILGIGAALVTFLPRVAVEPYGQFDPSSTSPTLFDISNVGPIPLLQIRPLLGLCRLSFEESPQMVGDCPNSGPIQARMLLNLWIRDNLASGDHYTIAMQDLFRPTPARPIRAADISIIVTYRVPFTWWRQEKEFRFFTKEEGDGKRYWFRK